MNLIMMTNLAAATPEFNIGQLLSFISGAGGATAVMWLWKNSLQADKESLKSDLKEERKRNQDFGDAFLALAAETNIHLQNAPDSVKSFHEVVSREHSETRQVVKDKADEIKSAVI